MTGRFSSERGAKNTADTRAHTHPSLSRLAGLLSSAAATSRTITPDCVRVCDKERKQPDLAVSKQKEHGANVGQLTLPRVAILSEEGD